MTKQFECQTLIRRQNPGRGLLAIELMSGPRTVCAISHRNQSAENDDSKIYSLPKRARGLAVVGLGGMIPAFMRTCVASRA